MSGQMCPAQGDIGHPRYLRSTVLKTWCQPNKTLAYMLRQSPIIATNVPLHKSLTPQRDDTKR
jgi:hypothetical protein